MHAWRFFKLCRRGYISKILIILLIPIILLTGCAPDGTDYFGEGSSDASFGNLTLHSNEESYLLGAYDVKDSDSTYRVRSLLTFNTQPNSGSDSVNNTDAIPENTISGVSSNKPGNTDFSNVKKKEWVTKELLAASAERQELVKYALQFVGNPYRWAGTSLTEGTDCSGFVQLVYKKFGYSLPRTSQSQRSAGKSVSSKNKKPGDVICYSGHVSIYIGDGKIVHAQSKDTGIVVSDTWNYRTVKSIRSIIND